jgi:hypothetical protein
VEQVIRDVKSLNLKVTSINYSNVIHMFSFTAACSAASNMHECSFYPRLTDCKEAESNIKFTSNTIVSIRDERKI